MSNYTDLSLRLRQALKGDEEIFLTNLKASIKSHISNKKPGECLRLVTYSNGYSREWKCTNVKDGAYVIRLIAYLRKKKYIEDGVEFEVDSTLTSEVLNIVSTKLSEAVNNHKELISKITLEALLKEEVNENLIDTLTETKPLSISKSVLSKTLFSALNGFISDTVSTTAMQNASKAIAAIGGKVVLTKLSFVVAKSLAPLITKLLAMPAIKLALKKIVIGAIFTSIFKIIGAKIGIATLGSAVVWILAPLLVLWIINDIYELPNKLSIEISEAVVSDMRQNYNQTIDYIVTSLISNLTSESVLANIRNNPDVIMEFNKIIKNIS